MFCVLKSTVEENEYIIVHQESGQNVLDWDIISYDLTFVQAQKVLSALIYEKVEGL